MVAVPFIYFLFLLIYVLKKKKRFDISAYLISIYLISAFFSILIDVFDYRSLDTSNYQISVLPTIMYCTLLTMVFYPFIKMKRINMDMYYNKEPKLFNFISYFYIVAFIITFIFSINIIIKIFIFNDFNEIRNMLYRGDSQEFSVLSNINPIYKPIFLLFDIFSSLSFIMLIFYFYSICFLKKPKWFNTLLLISSTTIILNGIIGIDRSKVIYWLIVYGFCFILFKDYLTKKSKKNLYIVSGIIISFLLFYFISVSNSRFGESDSGTSGGLIAYAGQSFINFCFFFDNHPYNGFTLQSIFPVFYKIFIDNNLLGNTQLQALMTAQTGVEHGIFNVFFGELSASSGNFVGIIYVIFYFLILNIIVRYVNKDFYGLLLIFLLISIPMLGIFSHFYADFSRMFVFIVFLIYSLSAPRVKFNI